MAKFIAILTIIIPALLGLTHVAAAVRPPDHPKKSHHELKPWEIWRLTTASTLPRYNPVRDFLNFTISDPNGDDPVARTNCSATWMEADSPYNITHDCDDTDVPGDSEWTFEMLESNSTYPYPTTDFVLRFTHTEKHGSWVGSARFAIGVNMEGTCSAAGVCFFELREDLIPFRINQTRRTIA